MFSDDEIHRMHISVEEILYSAMEDYRLDIVLGQDQVLVLCKSKWAIYLFCWCDNKSRSSQSQRTHGGNLHFDYYHEKELAQIVKNNAAKLEIAIEEEAQDLIAKCSRGHQNR